MNNTDTMQAAVWPLREVLVIALLVGGFTSVHSSDSASTAPQTAYGFAPYAWINVVICNNYTGWCQGKSETGFALARGGYDMALDRCTHYCPGTVLAHWTPGDSPGAQVDRNGTFIGAYAKRLSRTTCVEVPGGFGCSDRVMRRAPLNSVSIRLYASKRNAAYYFGQDPMADCEPGPQCSAYKLLRRTLFAKKNISWVDPDEVLTLRNSLYGCVLTYVGAGTSDNTALCYAQLGDHCFYANGARFCVGAGERGGPTSGITDHDEDASAPTAMCELSNSFAEAGVPGNYIPTPAEQRESIAAASCDVSMLPADHVGCRDGALRVHFDVVVAREVSEVAPVVLRVPFQECSMSCLDNARIATVRTIYKAYVASFSSGLMIDIAGWGQGECSDSVSTAGDLTERLVILASELRTKKIKRLLLGLPLSRDHLNGMNLTRLLPLFDLFVMPPGTADLNKIEHCQNLWVAPEGGGAGDKGALAYMSALNGRGVRSNKLMFTINLMGRMRIATHTTPPDINDVDLPLADLENNPTYTCEEDYYTKCCSGTTTSLWARRVWVNVSLSSSSFETLKRIPELVATALGINQFLVTPLNADFERTFRSRTPALSGVATAVHRLGDWKRQQVFAGVSTASGTPGARRWKRTVGNAEPLRDTQSKKPRSEYKDPSSGSKRVMDPGYIIGTSNNLSCPGLVAVHGPLGVFDTPYIELCSTSYDKIFIAHIYKLPSCTPGPPAARAAVSARHPQLAINVNTMTPTSDPAHYMVGILNAGDLVEYMPPVHKLCQAHDTGQPTQSVNVFLIDNKYELQTPVVDVSRGITLKPAKRLYFVSDFAPGVDYISLNVSCINHDTTALQPCLMAICGASRTCRVNFGKYCENAHQILDAARIAGGMVQEGLEELSVQEQKAKKHYSVDDNAPLPALERPVARKKRLLGVGGAITAAAAMALAVHVSARVDALEKQLDLTKNALIAVSRMQVEISNKLEKNIVLMDNRMNEQEARINKNYDISNRNFAMLRDALVQNAETALRDTNERFSVSTSFQLWYAQTQSITHQMSLAAMRVKFMALGVAGCLREIAKGRSGGCRSGLSVFQNEGLRDFPTVGAALYRNRKLFIVHRVPRTIEAKTVREVIPMPRMSNDGVPCWPDYRVWLIDDSFYEPSECHSGYCHRPEVHARYMRCLADTKECRTVCARCHRGMCYDNEKITWLEGSASVEIQTPPLRLLPRPHISDGPVSFMDLMKDTLPSVPAPEILDLLNTSIRLYSSKGVAKNLTDFLLAFSKEYDGISADRVNLLGFLSGFWSGGLQWIAGTLLEALFVICIVKVYFCFRSRAKNRQVVIEREWREKGKRL